VKTGSTIVDHRGRGVGAHRLCDGGPRRDRRLIRSLRPLAQKNPAIERILEAYRDTLAA
jgi:hypothetical protein